MKHIFLFIFFLIAIFSNRCIAQLGGNNSYHILNTAANYTTAAHNGYATALYDKHVGVGLYNPAMLNNQMNLQFVQSFNKPFYAANNGQSGIAINLNNKVNIAAGIQYIKYGDFKYANAGGELSGGTFGANDYVFQLSAQKNIRDSIFSLGISTKFITSTYEKFVSKAFAIDIAGAYINKQKRFLATALIRNAGFTTITNAINKPTLPFDVQLGVSKKMKHAPFRLCLTLHNLNKYNLIFPGTYISSDTTTIKAGLNSRNLTKQIDNIFRHTNLAIELNVKYIDFVISYNHLRQREQAYTFKSNIAGLAFGAGLNAKYFTLGLAYNNFNASVNSWFLTFALNIDKFIQK